MEVILALMVALPFLSALPCFALGKHDRSAAYTALITVAVIEAGLAAALALYGQGTELSFPRALGVGLSLHADGFRALYAAVAAFMWLITSLFTPGYMAHGHKQARYCAFSLLTLGATLGVFLSDDLATAFLFFEILSFTSYAWVIHEETPGAVRAGQTYLAIAILGGMAMLMGLMMLQMQLGTLRFEEMVEAAHSHDLLVPGLLILTGFGAKAGMVPLHVWLPKAHPVAPAPASALLSGILTKVGIFGILVISSRLFHGNALWGNLLLILGLCNMLLGAVLALFSTDLKRTLACSSMSQIGFILFGVGMQNLLGEHNALAAQGTVLHMVNHSLIKLVLFLCAGAVYLNTHSLNLSDIRGYGRGKYGLMALFAVGAASISGIPLFSGYASKTLLHESLVEFIHELQHHHESAFWYQAAEWVFIVSGGITLCYMLKLFIAIFIQENPAKQAKYDKMGRPMNQVGALAVGGAAALLFGLGLYPEGPLTALANMSLPFLHAHAPEHAVRFLTGVNLAGAAKSLGIGVVLYFTVVRLWLMDRKTGEYLDRWPKWLDLENAVYRPMTGALVKLGYLVSMPLDHMMDVALRASSFMMSVSTLLDRVMDYVLRALFFVMTLLSRLAEATTEAFSLLLMKTALRPRREKLIIPPVGTRVTFAMGRAADMLNIRIHQLFGMALPQRKYVYQFASAWAALKDTTKRIQRTLSFSLLLFALGLVVLLALMLAR